MALELCCFVQAAPNYRLDGSCAFVGVLRVFDFNTSVADIIDAVTQSQPEGALYTCLSEHISEEGHRHVLLHGAGPDDQEEEKVGVAPA